ncbi:MAG: uracil-DNA glycosylase [Planctomycetota bacterium]
MGFEAFVERIRRERKLTIEVPGFDSENGNEYAKFLFLLEAPGPKALESRQISFDNSDPTARNLKRQLSEAGICRRDIALWNIVPWYVGTWTQSKRRIRPAKRSDLIEAEPYLRALLEHMPLLETIVLVGKKAREAHTMLSRTTQARVVACHHPSAQSLNSDKRRDAENVEIFRLIRSSTL